MNKFYNKYKIGINTFFAGVFLNVVSSIVYSKIKNIDFASSFVQVWKLFYNFIINIMNCKIPIWSIIVVIIILYFILKLYFFVSEQKKAMKPEFLKYLSDEYKGINYQWEIDLYNGRLKKVQPICRCGAQLTTKHSYGNTHYSQPKLYCVNCDKIISEEFNSTILEDATLYFTNNYNSKVKGYNKNIKNGQN